MKKIIEFFKATIVGGLFVLLPVILKKAGSEMALLFFVSILKMSAIHVEL
jgi:hypothetical protein